MLQGRTVGTFSELRSFRPTVSSMHHEILMLAQAVCPVHASTYSTAASTGLASGTFLGLYCTAMYTSVVKLFRNMS